MAGTARAAATKPVPQAALKAVAVTLCNPGNNPGGTEATTGVVSFLRARIANKVLMKAEVIDRARATAMVVDLARPVRDA